MRKKFRAKKKIKSTYLIIILVFIFVMTLFSYIQHHVSITLPNSKFIDIVWKSGNEYSYNNIKNTNLSANIYKYLKDNIFNSPLYILKNQLNYIENSSSTISFLYSEKKEPMIYIYNSHQGETYSIKYLEDYNIVPDVMMAASMLKDKLDNTGIYTEVENNDILKYMKENNLNHSGSYIASRHFLTTAMEKYPNTKLYIDLHRDAANHSVTTTTINGKECAKIMFVIGLEYNTYENNLKIVTDINNIINIKYPSLSRGILKKQGKGVNGVYNQDLGSNVILIEIGGNENNIEEINNTLDLIAEVLGDYINEKK